MSGANLFALCPYVVTADVSVELPLISMEVTLCFGPFNTLIAAEKWAGDVERLHKDIIAREDQTSNEIFDEIGIPTQGFIRSHIYGMDIVQSDQNARKPGMLIPVNTPDTDSRDMHLYALAAFQQAIHMAFSIAKNE